MYVVTRKGENGAAASANRQTEKEAKKAGEEERKKRAELGLIKLPLIPDREEKQRAARP